MESKNLNFLDQMSDEFSFNTIHIVKDGKEEKLRIEEIFDKDKYDYFIGVTYSVSSSFVNNYLKDFKDIEIVIGIDNDLIKNSINKLAKNLQNNISKQIQGEPIRFFEKLDRKSKFKLNKNELKLWVSNTYVIHSKFYLLWNENGDNRLILGSANLSNMAFYNKSSQFENIVIFDNSKLFDIYLKYYKENLSKILCDYIPKELKKLNAKNFKNIDKIEDIDFYEVTLLDNDDVKKIIEKSSVSMIEVLRKS